MFITCEKVLEMQENLYLYSQQTKLKSIDVLKFTYMPQNMLSIQKIQTNHMAIHGITQLSQNILSIHVVHNSQMVFHVITNYLYKCHKHPYTPSKYIVVMTLINKYLQFSQNIILV